MQGSPKPIETTERGFSPACPTCKYDLSGIPEGKCPECGGAFTLAGLMALHNRPRFKWPLAVLAGLWSIGWLVACVYIESSLRDEQPPAIALFWIGICLLWVFRREMTGASAIAFPAVALAAALASGALAGTSMQTPTSGSERLRTYLLAACIALILAWLATPPRRLGPLLSALGACPFGVGCIMALQSGFGLARNEHWSVWADVRPWQPFIQYPLSNPEAFIVGISLALMGLALALVLPIRKAIRVRNAERANRSP